MKNHISENTNNNQGYLKIATLSALKGKLAKVFCYITVKLNKKESVIMQDIYITSL